MGKSTLAFHGVGPTISEAAKGWWGEGLGDFEKYKYTVYTGSAHR